MQFDFYKKLSGLSNNQLIEFVSFPEKRQKEALEMAYIILSERAVGQDFIVYQKEEIITNKQREATNKVQRKKTFSNFSIRFFNLNLNKNALADWDLFDEEAEQQKQTIEIDEPTIVNKLYFLLLFPLLQVLFGLYDLVTSLPYFDLTKSYESFVFSYILTYLMFNVLIVYYVHKRKARAWSFLLVNAILSALLQIIYLWNNKDWIGFENGYYYALLFRLFYIFLTVVSIWLLNKADVIKHFKISVSQRSNAWLVALIISALLGFLTYLYS